MCGCDGSGRRALHAWAVALVALIILGVVASQDKQSAAPAAPHAGAAAISSTIAR